MQKAGKYLTDAATHESHHNSESDCTICATGKWSGSAYTVCTACK